ncbi:uncharacterized protein LOC124267868 [Haliotis rubra]|uniref:uncharacterized protein LOC124267868 n=1 Tax=Haliotis rubra TaxID=36100 RepID=UPI001EE624A8|nr:uncharacterized protein LOC124267868 [Haliotis rubra]
MQTGKLLLGKLRRIRLSFLKATVSNQQVNALAKGLKFALTPPRINSDLFIANIEKGLQQLAPGGKVDYLRHQISNILYKAQPQKPNITPSEKQAIKQLKQDPDIVIAPADKGKATVVLDKDHFNTMVDNLLDDTATYKKINKDPTTKLNRQHKSTLKLLHDKFELSTDLYRKLSVSHPQPPYARATVKIHKNPVKTRLLVCSRDTVFYNTAQHLTKVLAPLGKSANSFINDSTDFCSKIRDISNPGPIISYDVVDLFTNVPREEALQALRHRIDKLQQPLNTSLSTDSIISLTSTCINSTYFTWGDEIYEQIHGLPMGSPYPHPNRNLHDGPGR